MSNLFGEKEMRALSWKQPFAELMLHGKIETRKWNTKYRGLVLICASKQPYSESQLIGICGELIAQRILVYLNQNSIRERKGLAIAVGKLIDSRPMRPEDEEQAWVKYNPQGLLYSHIYEDVRPINPFEWHGVQGWKNIEQSIIDKIEYL